MSDGIRSSTGYFEELAEIAEVHFIDGVAKEDDFFRDRLTVMNGAVAWDVTGTRDETKCIDLDPYEMYDHCPVVKDPLSDEPA